MIASLARALLKERFLLTDWFCKRWIVLHRGVKLASAASLESNTGFKPNRLCSVTYFVAAFATIRSMTSVCTASNGKRTRKKLP
mmetsp:Transcript_22305/g.46895  ORF Transcript_22305/g.46895 Transcript_22305/m.46895 type:complete len:84 (-) Transcript_22305:1228-1479(-)